MSARQASIWISIAVSVGCVPHTDPPAATAQAAPDAQSPPAAAPPSAPTPSTETAAFPQPTSPAPADPATGGIASVDPAPTDPAPTDSTPAGSAPADLAPADPPPGNFAAAAPASRPTAEENGAERVAAKAGEGKQGQSLKEHSGVYVEAAKAYFNVRQRAVFEIQIPKALDLYAASEGHKPRTHEEFMTKIIAANSITLPNLPAGNRYVYDPRRGELMVEKPRR